MSDLNQVFYNGKWHDKNHFRVYVYNSAGEKKLCRNWWEYDVLKQGGLWFDSKPEPEPEIKPIASKASRHKRKKGGD